MSKRCCAKSCYNSQMKNRMVHYFGFPKNEDFARKWAIAAGREDLLDKPIQNIIKYFLCSSHFTEDCFQDPPLNSKLKKTTRPVTVPIPTIFISNIEQFLPGDEESLSCDVKEATVNEPATPQNKISLLKRPRIDEQLKEILCNSPTPSEMVPIYLEEYELPAKHVRHVVIPWLSESDIEIERLEEEESPSDELIAGSNEYYVKVELNEDEGDQGENMVATEFTCRLCSNEFFERQMLFFQDDEHIIDLINSVLPRSVIQSDDYLPQQICISCLGKVHQCREIMNGFEMVQERLSDN